MTLTKRCGRLWQTADRISAWQLTRVRPASRQACFLLQTFLSQFGSASVFFSFFFFFFLDFLELCSAHVHNRPLCNLQGNLRQGLHTLAKLSCVGCAGVSQQVPSVDSLSSGKINTSEHLNAFHARIRWDLIFFPISFTAFDVRK